MVASVCSILEPAADMMKSGYNQDYTGSDVLEDENLILRHCFPLELTCPEMKPFPFAYGLKCCRYHARSETCASNSPPGHLLSKEDEENCCIKDEYEDCLDSTGRTALCGEHDDASSEFMILMQTKVLFEPAVFIALFNFYPQKAVIGESTGFMF